MSAWSGGDRRSLSAFVRRKAHLAFAAAFVILLIVGAVSYRAIAASRDGDGWVRHTHEVLESLDGLLLNLATVELTTHEYVLTGSDADVSAYEAGVTAAQNSVAVLQQLTVDNPGQQDRIARLKPLVAQAVMVTGAIVDLRRTDGFQAAEEQLSLRATGSLIASPNALVAEMQDVEQRLRTDRIAEAAAIQSQSEPILIVGTGLGLLITAAAAWSVRRDSAKRGRAEVALRQSEDNYRTLVDGVQDYAIVMLNPEGEVLSWNPGAQALTHATKEQAIGNSFAQFYPPDAIAAGVPQEILRKTAELGIYEEQGLRLRPDGAPFAVRTTFTALHAADGKLRGFSVISRDVSGSNASEARYRGLLEAAPDAMVVVDQAGQIILLNLQAESQFGYRRDELLGQPVTNIIPEGFAERLIADDLRSAADALAQQIGTGIELIALRKDGTEFPIEIMLSPLQSVDGVLITAAIRDISVRKAAELSLAQSEGRYRGLLEAAPDAMVVVNQAGQIVLLNLQAESQFGYRRDELIGQPVKNLIPEGFAERIASDGLRSAADALAQQIGTGIELSAMRKDGTEFPIELMLSPLQSPDGILVTAAIRDISVRKAAELHLAQMESRYRGLLEAAPDAMVVVDQGGQIVLLNVQAEKRFGYHRDELLGQQVTNIIPVGFAERIVSDGLRSAADALAQVIGTGIELTALRKDGTEFPIELMLSPLQSPDGTLVTAAIRDISVRKAAETHLVHMEGRYRGLLEAAPDAMVVVDQRGEIVLLNVQAEKRFGYHRDELLGQPVTNIIPDGFAERIVADSLRSEADALAQQIGTGIELSALRKDGTDFPIELMLSPLQSTEGILVTAAIRDISVRKAAEVNLLQTMHELERSNEELGQFAYIASHDLQEPLRMVASYTQLLSRRYKGKLDSDADDFIAYAVDGATRMQQLIEDLLTYSRVGTRGLHLEPTSSEEALSTAIGNLQASVNESGAMVTHDALPMVLADQTQLTQLFQNLVGNAIKYQSPGTPRVHVSAVANPMKGWDFSVKDNGLGIEPQYFERIFGMFQRLHKRDEFAGTGIGLAICKKIVERHGGTISVESAPGQGSTFHFGMAAA